MDTISNQAVHFLYFIHCLYLLESLLLYCFSQDWYLCICWYVQCHDTFVPCLFLVEAIKELSLCLWHIKVPNMLVSFRFSDNYAKQMVSLIPLAMFFFDSYFSKLSDFWVIMVIFARAKGINKKIRIKNLWLPMQRCKIMLAGSNCWWHLCEKTNCDLS